MFYFEGTYTPEEFETVLRGLGRDVYFLQVGANDGVTDDQIYKIVRELGWSGLLIEPMPNTFETLKQNYADCKGLTFVQAAVTDYEGLIELTRGTPEALKIYPSNAIATVTPEKSFFAINDPRFRETINVPCSRLNPILEAHDVKRIDLLVVDVEGADWMVTRQLSLDEYRPLVALVECHQMTMFEKISFCEHFRNYGYRIYVSQNAVDFLAVRWPALKNTPLKLKAPFQADFTTTRQPTPAREA